MTWFNVQCTLIELATVQLLYYICCIHLICGVWTCDCRKLWRRSWSSWLCLSCFTCWLYMLVPFTAIELWRILLTEPRQLQQCRIIEFQLSGLFCYDSFSTDVVSHDLVDHAFFTSLEMSNWSIDGWCDLSFSLMKKFYGLMLIAVFLKYLLPTHYVTANCSLVEK